MLTFRRLALVTALAALSLGCERQSASTDVDADVQTTTSQGLVGSTIGAGTDPLRPIFGRGDFGFIPMFVGAQSIANSGIFQSGHRIIVGGTEPAARFQVQDAFTGVGNLVELHQVEPTGDITLEFSQAPLNPQDVMGNIGVVRSRDGKPERFVVVGAGSNPRNLPLTLAEDGGNVGIGTSDPHTKLDVVGSASVRGDLTVFDGRVHLGGTATPAGRLQISDNFAGFGPTGQILSIHQVDPTGDINLEFSQSGFGVMGNVGIGLVTPLAKLDVLGDVAVRGTGNTCCALHVQNDFAGFGTIASIHQVNPTGDISLEFSQSGFGVMGNVGVIRSSGGPERFVILGAGRNPRNLSLALVEDGGNVGIGTADPRTKLDVVGNTSISGNLSVTGTKSSVATLSDGRRVLLYAVESPKNWFEDFGTAKLQRGEAWVPLEPVFGETVNTADTYHVFLTPSGDCKGLYIAERRADGFLVRELGGGRSTVSFDYRIVAPRRGFETVRLSELP